MLQGFVASPLRLWCMAAFYLSEWNEPYLPYLSKSSIIYQREEKNLLQWVEWTHGPYLTGFIPLPQRFTSAVEWTLLSLSASLHSTYTGKLHHVPISSHFSCFLSYILNGYRLHNDICLALKYFYFTQKVHFTMVLIKNSSQRKCKWLNVPKVGCLNNSSVTGLHVQKAYTSLGTPSMQILLTLTVTQIHPMTYGQGQGYHFSGHQS